VVGDAADSGLTVVAPWTSEDVLDVGVAALLLAHLDDWIRFRENKTEIKAIRSIDG